jgi:hypothetical protein
LRKWIARNEEEAMVASWALARKEGAHAAPKSTMARGAHDGLTGKMNEELMAS